MGLERLEALEDGRQDVDEVFKRRLKLLRYIMPGDTLSNNGGGKKFEVLSIGPKKQFAYGFYEESDAPRERKRFSLSRLAEEYTHISRPEEI